MSGPTNLDNWDHPGLDDEDYVDFERRVDKYVGLMYPDHTHGPLLAASPAYLITNGGVTSSPPVKLYASEFDTVSWIQEDDMYNALFGIGALVTKTFFPGSYNHAYDNWHVIDPITFNCVSSDVIAFFQSHP